MAVSLPNNGAKERTLLAELYHATRSEHAVLNRAIVAHLPLCLPPVAPDPYFYAAGMTVYGQIYEALEESWLRILEELRNSKENNRHYEMLSTLSTQYLERSEHLKADLANLKRSLKPQAMISLDQLQTQSSHFRTRITDSISASPHLVLAYAWPMYLALFNGGRWIASQLLESGDSFWQAVPSQTAQDYLSFWYFDDSVHDGQHGESVKLDFKQRFNEASDLLTPTEREEVILEAKRVFEICTEMIELLDQYALGFVPRQAVLSPSGKATNTLTRMASIFPLNEVWQRLGAVIGYVAAPTGLGKNLSNPIE